MLFKYGLHHFESFRILLVDLSLLGRYEKFDIVLNFGLLVICLFDGVLHAGEKGLDRLDLVVALSLSLLVGLECIYELLYFLLNILELHDSFISLHYNLVLLLLYLFLCLFKIFVVRICCLLHLYLHLLELLNDLVVFRLNIVLEIIKALLHFSRILNILSLPLKV